MLEHALYDLKVGIYVFIETLSATLLWIPDWVFEQMVDSVTLTGQYDGLFVYLAVSIECQII